VTHVQCPWPETGGGRKGAKRVSEPTLRTWVGPLMDIILVTGRALFGLGPLTNSLTYVAHVSLKNNLWTLTGLVETADWKLSPRRAGSARALSLSLGTQTRRRPPTATEMGGGSVDSSHFLDQTTDAARCQPSCIILERKKKVKKNRGKGESPLRTEVFFFLTTARRV
jgi:hypothetical protein